MTETLRDQAARDRIVSDLDANLSVEAGAGTGKTTVLVRRVVALLVSGAAVVDDLAVITFTEKAAGELAARVRFALENARDDASRPGEERERAERALTDLYRARVQTIHAFASDLLRERPVEARLDPQFETLEAISADVRFEEAYRAWLDEQLATSNPRIETAVRRGMELKGLRELYEIVHRHREVLPLTTLDPPRPDLAAFRARASDWSAQLDELETQVLDEADAGYPQLQRLREFSRHVMAAETDEDVERLILFEAPWIVKNAGRADNWRDDGCRRLKAIFVEYRDQHYETLPAELRTEALAELLPLAERFALDYAEQRRRDGVADFDDLLIWARDFVRDDLNVRRHFHSRTRRILVDEFQDTDPVQSELITWLAAPDGATGDWRAVTPEPGCLFVVGDPKQSIYRFRGADIAAYDAVRNGPLAGEAERLIQNFRSSDELLHWLNRVFDRVLEKREGLQPANTHLYGQVEMAEHLGRPPIVVVREPAPAAKVAARRRQESELLARTIARAVRTEHWQVRDRRTGDDPRDVQWRDVAILVPSRTGIEGLEAALNRYGVPYRFEGGRGFFSRQEVRDLVSVLHAVDDPTDAISLVAALRSLAFGCSDDDLMLWSLEVGRFDYRGVEDEGPGPQSVRQAMIMLRRLGNAAPKLSLGELVRVVIGETGLADAALSLPSGRQAAANVMKLLDQAREFSAAGNGALRAFTGWLARMRDEEAQEIPDAPVAEERDDAVRVMTIHAAKGLEFPVVCLGNLESTGSNQAAPVPDAPANTIELKVGSKKKRTSFCTPGWDDASEREKDALQAERDRLLYVACTRARDHLVIPAANSPDQAKGFLARLMESIQGEGGTDSGFHVYDVGALSDVQEVQAPVETTADDAAVRAAADTRAEWAAARAALVREAATGIEIVNASSIKVETRPIAAQREAAPDSDEVSTINVGGTPPLELGDAFHRVMERVSLPDAEDLEPLARAICAEAQIPDLDLVVEMARRCLDSDIVRRAIASGDMHREIPFVIEGEDGAVIVGRIDLLFRDGEDVVVLDYKTDRDENPETHGAQARNYALAVRETLGVDGEVHLLYARSGTTAAVA